MSDRIVAQDLEEAFYLLSMVGAKVEFVVLEDTYPCISYCGEGCPGHEFEHPLRGLKFWTPTGQERMIAEDYDQYEGDTYLVGVRRMY